MISILLVDDEGDWLDSISRTLAKYNISDKDNIFKAENGARALKILSKEKIDLVMLDLYLENENGEFILEEIMRNNPHQKVVMMTGSNSVEHAVSCMKLGAKDYFIKSTPIHELVENLQRIMRLIRLEDENDCLRKQMMSKTSYPEFEEYITNSSEIHMIFAYIKAVSKSSEHLLITGESGVGKGIIAKAAANIFRPGKPFVSVNIAGYDNQMFSDALFGHVKGAYTGADSARPGVIRQAEDGVIFLDEIGDLSLQSQVKLLSLIQDGEYRQLGSDKILKTSAKFIFATNRDLSEMLKNKTFRHDLYFRLNTHCVNITPLRQRHEDIEKLIWFFSAEAAKSFGKESLYFTDGFITTLKNYEFPGNIRELRSIIYDIIARFDGVIDINKLPQNINKNVFKNDTSEIIGDSDIPTIEAMSNILIKKAMIKAGGNQIKAAKILGISQPTLSRKLKELNI